MKLPRLRGRRPRRIPELMFPDEDDEEAARDGYVFTADFGGPPPMMRLTEPIIKPRPDRFFVSSPQELVSGQCYLLGAPWLPNCEVVEVVDDEPSGDGSRRIHRARFKTVGSSHPAGTSVIAVTVTFVEDWSCADSADQEP